MSRTVRAVLNESNPSLIASAEQILPLGTALALLPRTVRATPNASHQVVLPNNAKAKQVTRVFVRAAGANTGYLIIDPTEATPAAGHAAVTQLGNVELAAADAATDVEVTYIPIEGDVVTETISVVAGTGVGTLLGGKSAQLLLSSQATVGGAVGVETIDVRAASAPAAGHSKLNLLGQPTFAVADAVTQAVVTYIAFPGVGSASPSVGTQLDSSVEF